MRFYFRTSKFHHKLRAKRKKDCEKEVFTVGSVSETARNGKINDIWWKIVEKRELRTVQSVLSSLWEGLVWKAITVLECWRTDFSYYCYQKDVDSCLKIVFEKMFFWKTVSPKIVFFKKLFLWKIVFREIVFVNCNKLRKNIFWNENLFLPKIVFWKIVFVKNCFLKNCFCEKLFFEKLLCCPHLFGNSNNMCLFMIYFELEVKAIRWWDRDYDTQQCFYVL